MNGTDSELVQELMEGNYSLPNISTLLGQLDTIDNAACGWTRFMSQVGQVRDSESAMSHDLQVAESPRTVSSRDVETKAVTSSNRATPFSLCA